MFPKALKFLSSQYCIRWCWKSRSFLKLFFPPAPVKESALCGVWWSFLPSHISRLGPSSPPQGMSSLSTADQQPCDDVLGEWFLGSVGAGAVVSLCISVGRAHLAPSPPPAPSGTNCHHAAVRRCSPPYLPGVVFPVTLWNAPPFLYLKM